MTRTKFRYTAVAVAALFLMLAPAAQAQSSRVYVSTLGGSDSNPCTLMRPCRTITHALTLAPPDVVLLFSGDYDPFTVTRSVTVEAAPGISASITQAQSNKSAITISAANKSVVVTLRGLTLNGLGTGANGIYADAAFSNGQLNVEGCLIDGFLGNDATSGMLNQNGVFSGAGKMFVNSTTVRNCGFGIRFQGTAASVVNTIATHNDSGFGADTGQGAAQLVLENCTATNNFHGLSAGPSSQVDVSNSTFSGNSIGLWAFIGVAVVANTTITQNSFGLEEFQGGTIYSYGNNKLNYNTTDGSFTGLFQFR